MGVKQARMDLRHLLTPTLTLPSRQSERYTALVPKPVSAAKVQPLAVLRRSRGFAETNQFARTRLVGTIAMDVARICLRRSMRGRFSSSLARATAVFARIGSDSFLLPLRTPGR